MPRQRAYIIGLLLLAIAGCKRNSRDEITHDTSQVAGATDTAPHQPAQPTIDSVEPSPTENNTPSRWNTYVDEEHGFSFSYPEGLRVRKGFDESHHLTRQWRAMATPDQKGAAIVSVPIVRITSEKGYPRYYDVDFRVGLSTGGAAAGSPKNGERSIGKIEINGQSFDQYEFSDAAMMQYVSGISYRTLHNGQYFALEQIRSGSNYRDEKSANDRPQKELDSLYFIAGKIVKTFKFLR